MVRTRAAMEKGNKNCRVGGIQRKRITPAVALRGKCSLRAVRFHVPTGSSSNQKIRLDTNHIG